MIMHERPTEAVNGVVHSGNRQLLLQSSVTPTGVTEGRLYVIESSK